MRRPRVTIEGHVGVTEAGAAAIPVPARGATFLEGQPSEVPERLARPHAIGTWTVPATVVVVTTATW